MSLENTTPDGKVLQHEELAVAEETTEAEMTDPPLPSTAALLDRMGLSPMTLVRTDTTELQSVGGVTVPVTSRFAPHHRAQTLHKLNHMSSQHQVKANSLRHLRKADPEEEKQTEP